VGVLCVDPSSPFTGGAILGDRIRMQDHATNEHVFIRSMATRGHLGGLSLAVPDALRVLGAANFRLALVETVGVGQMEVDIASAADTTVVVTNPGWGDAMQASKAGLLEVADIFVINKADRPGLRETRRDLEQMLELGEHAWRPPIIETTATSGAGTAELWDAIVEHRAHLLEGNYEVHRRARLRRELDKVLSAMLRSKVTELAHGVSYDANSTRSSRARPTPTTPPRSCSPSHDRDFNDVRPGVPGAPSRRGDDLDRFRRDAVLRSRGRARRRREDPAREVPEPAKLRRTSAAPAADHRAHHVVER